MRVIDKGSSNKKINIENEIISGGSDLRDIFTYEWII